MIAEWGGEANAVNTMAIIVGHVSYVPVFSRSPNEAAKDCLLEMSFTDADEVIEECWPQKTQKKRTPFFAFFEFFAPIPSVEIHA